MLENPTRYDTAELGTSSAYVDQRVEYAVVGNGVGEVDLGDYMRIPMLPEGSLESIPLQEDHDNEPPVDSAASVLRFVLEPTTDDGSLSSSEQTAVQSLQGRDLSAIKLPDVDVIVKTEREEQVVIFSSTPDMDHTLKSPSNDSYADSATEGARTPIVDPFIMELDQKLLELVDGGGDDNRENWYLYDPESFYTGTHSGYESYISSRMGYTRSLTVTKQHTARHSPGPPPCPPSVLKRKRSAALQETHSDFKREASESAGSDANENLDPSAPPASKRARPVQETSFSYLAKEAASVRRARSLTTNPSIDVLTDTISTVPASPHESDYDTESTGTNQIDEELERRRQLIPSLPIIAPPPFQDIPRAPTSPDEAAEIRLHVLLEKEKSARRVDGFEKGINYCFDGVTQEQIDQFLGIEEDLRKSVVDWMLAVTPGKSLRLPQLREHLRNCPETRYHAILLFSRYFMRVGEEMPVAGKRETNLMKRGRQRIVWEVAMSCLALSVKFNRDFLHPLTPVHSRSFVAIAPYSMSHDDLEISQKDVLEVLSYQIREVTPGPFLEEIWNSLPTLRKLVAFPEGWTTVQQNVWRRLNACAPGTVHK